MTPSCGGIQEPHDGVIKVENYLSVIRWNSSRSAGMPSRSGRFAIFRDHRLYVATTRSNTVCSAWSVARPIDDQNKTTDCQESGRGPSSTRLECRLFDD